MSSIFEEILAEFNVSKGTDFNRWLLKKFRASSTSVDEFAVFYMSLVRSQTDEFVKNNTSTCNTPRKMTLGSIDPADLPTGILQEEHPPLHNDNRVAKRQSSRELFSIPPTESPQFFGRNSLETSTPVGSLKLNRSIEGTPNQTSTPHSLRNSKNSFSFDQSPMTIKNSSRNSLDLSSRNNSINRRNTSASTFCLGDFINTSTSSNSGKHGKKKNTSLHGRDPAIKFSSADFPSLGEESLEESKPKKSQSANKPKKRVAPITLSSEPSGASNFILSSFQGENNLVNLPSEDGFDILSERRMLRDQRESIKQDFTTETEPFNLHAMIRENLPKVAQSPRSVSKLKPFEFDASKVVQKKLLSFMARIYSFILDLNLVANILSELSYIFNLLNTEYEPVELDSAQNTNKSPVEIASNLLKNLQNCIFFTVQVINCQKENLELLDVMTLRVIIDNERLQQLSIDLCEHLKQKIHQKSQIDSTNMFSFNNTNGVNRVVLFQQETDNIDNFPSTQEFAAFKKQRDIFYSILDEWEVKHLDQNFNFAIHLERKVKSLITLMEHPINMAHLARLFTAQLIISCNFDSTANDLQMVLPNVDLSKLSKLRQRLVAPSQFSTQYLFPGNQSFFKDFIICCDQHMFFIEQLKVSLIYELMTINDSPMETLCITNEGVKKDQNFREEFSIRPEAMATARVLAKFIGFVISRPYSFEGYRNDLVDQKQLRIRNLLHPDFDVAKVVACAVEGRKLLVTVPWLVEYLAMLDHITIRLDYYRDLFQLLYSVYMKVNVVNRSDSICVTPTSKFIIRTCLGWLFEHPEVPVEYYSSSNSKSLLKEIADVGTKEKNFDYNPFLESILNVACPFLADFRVSMMPNKTTKALSRTGRYRHITTKFQDRSRVQTPKVLGKRERLIEAILASQSLSVRKIVDVTVDRVGSAAVKDFQFQHLLIIRKEAKAEVEKSVLSAKTTEEVVKKMTLIYHEHLKRLQEFWGQDVRKNCDARVEAAFEALLPLETLPDVKKTLVKISAEKAFEKAQGWCSGNLSSIEIFSRDIKLDAAKFFENRDSEGKSNTSSLVIDLSFALPSDYFKILQTLLHKASRQAHKIEVNELMECVDMAVEVIEKQTLPLNAYRNTAFYMLQLVILCIISRCELITNVFLEKLFKLWRLEKLSPYISAPPTTDKAPKRKVEDFIFSNVISARLIFTMQGKGRRTLEAYGDFIIELVKEKFITIDHINEQSVRLYKTEWSTESLNDIACLINHVKSSLPSATVSESQDFMSLVADLARDMEDF